MGRTSIVIVSFNHRHFLGPCLDAVDRAGLDPAAVRIILVDNASSDGTQAFVSGELLQEGATRTRGGLPVVFIPHHCNSGFAGGNNLGIARAIAEGDDFVYLLNPDTEAEPGFLDAAIAAAESDPAIAIVQSLIMRHGPGERINTFGNALHFLGFGYAAGDGLPLDHPDAQARLCHGVVDIGFASGAGMLVRTSILAAIGSLRDELFVYEEDLELSWRALLAGHRVVLAPASRIRHKYEFSKSTGKFFWLERNRWLVLAWYYRLPTLALLAPALLTMEAGLWAVAWRGGWLSEKARAARYFLEPGRWAAIKATRAEVQALRQRSDREVSERFTGEIVFEAMSPWLLTHVANPIFAAYWRTVRKLLRW